LAQEVLFRAAVSCMIEEAHLDPGTAKLLQEHGLVGVVAREAIRAVDVEPVDLPGGHPIPELFQGGSLQGRTAVALIGESEGIGKSETIGCDPSVEGGELAGDRAGVGLLLGGDARVQGHLEGGHRLLPSAVWYHPSAAPRCR
jgi:hypothetical protein